ncbi:nitrous oxide reductase accessory protein NosL [Alkalilacustris brevis]|uniref:nitrous oxide reductase accessory protein NosL n=1 Tax=Alkalilacustris brevis TaxID=2026338 RepID=UPI000E0D8327|nr:nitrous oxide reductase accessory protein NosL [Alkalilacustris brevis]
MTRAFCLSAAILLALAGCREETAADLPPPVAMTAEAVGHYCQMELLEHPGPKAQVHLTGLPDPLFFSQVRDAIAYQRMPEQSHMIAVIYVSDMGAAPGWENPGAENWIEATGAHYVLGAEVAGGMGAPELVPFSDPEAAKAFAARHGGEVRRLSDIADTDVLAPAEIGHSGAPSGDDDIDPGTDDSLTDRLRALTRDEES